MPTTGSTGSLRSRGYLLGLTEAVTQQFAELKPQQEEFIALLASTFAVTYGPCDWGWDWDWALDAIDHCKGGNQDVLDGVRLAHRDVHSAYSGEPFAVTTGFWLLNHGDEDAIRYNLASLRT